MIRHGSVLFATVLLAACAPSTPDSIEGDWTFVEFTVDGETHDVVVGENTRIQPWVELTANGMNGSAGCNSFRGGYRYEDGILEAHAGGTLMWCGDREGSLMRVEFLFTQMITRGPLTVTTQGNRLTWTGPDSALVLAKGKP